jgi:hypothetical protein
MAESPTVADEPDRPAYATGGLVQALVVPAGVGGGCFIPPFTRTRTRGRHYETDQVRPDGPLGLLVQPEPGESLIGVADRTARLIGDYWPGETTG